MCYRENIAIEVNTVLSKIEYWWEKKTIVMKKQLLNFPICYVGSWVSNVTTVEPDTTN
jgi:hypothetical protein